MTSMIERVARAMHTFNTTPFPNLSVWENIPEDWRLLYLGRARAAIEAMQDPSPGMTRAGDEAGGGAGKCESSPVTDGIWSAMIDAALKEQP